MLRLRDFTFEFVYCEYCYKEEWHLLSKDGHLECLGCRCKEV